MDSRGAATAPRNVPAASSKKPSMGNWTMLACGLQEDILLRRLVESFGPQKWSVIAEKIKVREQSICSPAWSSFGALNRSHRADAPVWLWHAGSLWKELQIAVSKHTSTARQRGLSHKSLQEASSVDAACACNAAMGCALSFSCSIATSLPTW